MPADNAPTLAALSASLAAPPRPLAAWRGVLLVLAAAAWFSAGPLGVAVVALLLVLSDGLTLAAMRLTGLEDRDLLVLPLAAKAAGPGAPPAAEAALLAVQPLVLLAVALGTYAGSGGSGLWLGVAQVAAPLAAVLLVPVRPFTGWRLFDLGLYGRSRRLEVVMTGLFAGLVIVAGAASREVVLMALGAFLGVATFNVASLGRAAAALRESGVPLDAPAGALPPAVLGALRRAVEANLAPALARWRARPAETALRVETNFLSEVYRRAARRPAPAGVAAAVLAVWLGSACALAWLGWRFYLLRHGG